MPVEERQGLLHAAATALSEGSHRLGVAVSGGSDSLAALHLLLDVGAQVRVATVNHGLRPEAATEARGVGQHCAQMNVPHDTLTWRDGPQGHGNLMEQARDARYALLAEWARGHGIDRVVLGHTADDQAETFLLALARGTGLDGLTGMRRDFTLGGVTFVRPFLTVTRAKLRSYLQQKGVAWIDDPSNDNPRFARTHARQALQALQPMGVTAEKINLTMSNLRQSQAALRQAVALGCKDATTEMAGAVKIAPQAFSGLAEDVQRRLLVAIVQWLAGGPHPPRADGIARLHTAILRAGSVTLGGCSLKAGWLLREAKAVSGALPTTALWDNRWRLVGPHASDLRIRALGDGLRLCPDWRETGLRRDLLMVSPAIWQGDRLIAAPLAGLPNGWTAEIAQSLHAFILSH